MTATKTCWTWKLSPWEKKPNKQIQSRTQTENNYIQKTHKNPNSTQFQTAKNTGITSAGETEQQQKDKKIKNSGDEYCMEQDWGPPVTNFLKLPEDYEAPSHAK